MDGGAKEATATTSYTAHKEPETTTCSTMFHRRPTIRDIEEAESPCRPPATPMQQRPVPSSREDESSCGCGWFIDVPSDEDPWSSYSGGDDASYSPSRHHFLDECRMCGKYLGRDMDIYMYKGDTPFCSEECREEQIRIDEAAQLRKRRRWQKQQHEVVEKSRAANSTASAAVAVVAV